MVQLDLSFDAKEHHGLEALNMIQHILEVRQQYSHMNMCASLKFTRVTLTSELFHTATTDGPASGVGFEAILA